MADGTSKRDFFVSYNKADRAAAEWIAWQLEERGKYTVTIQAWDFTAGSNFVLEMDRATKQCERVVTVLSPDYLSSRFTKPEWAAYFAQDPASDRHAILPVRVRDCNVEGLLGPIVHIDLVAKDEDGATRALLDGVKAAIAAGTAHANKPTTKPAFFGSLPRVIPTKPRFFGALPDIWNVPHLRNPSFTEPGTQLADIRAALCSKKPAALTQTLAGLGGVGKTQLAIEYAYRQAGEYAIVWWLRAERPAALAADYAALAQRLGLPEKDAKEQSIAVAAVRDALRRRRDWLLVFDNAEKPEDIRGYLPGAGGHVLITSRYAAWGGVAQKVEVKKWPPEVAVEFLTKRTRQSDARVAAELARQLDYLPLALEQTAAYVESTGGTLAGYLALFKTHQVELLRRGSLGGDYPATVATTWEVSFERLEKESPAGAALLNLCVFFAPDDIPRDVISAGAQHLPEPLRATAADPLTFDEAVAALRQYSLIETGPDATLSLHRLVQAVIRDRLGEAGRRQWAEAAVEVVNAAFPYDSDDVRTWGECARLLPHAVATTDFAEPLGVGLEVAARLLDQMGLYSRGRAEYATAKAAYERALAIAEKAFGPEHPNVATVVNNLGLVLEDLVDLPGAKAAYERARRIDDKAFGPEHPNVATVVNNLGLVLKALGDLPGAKAACERALRIDEKAFGPEHPNVATVVNNLGLVLKDLGDLPGAKAAIERALRIDEKAFGPEHPNVASRVNNLGSLLKASGDLPGAKAAFERALRIAEKAFGPEHPNVATVVNNLASVLKDLGDLPGAKAAFERALAIRRRFLGEDHPATKRVRQNLESLPRE
jgi:tetratricopeptide (TPR) repeat protein